MHEKQHTEIRPSQTQASQGNRKHTQTDKPIPNCILSIEGGKPFAGEGQAARKPMGMIFTDGGSQKNWQRLQK
jgi:hypothetical protein